MRKELLLLLLVLTPLTAYSQNETMNETLNETFTNASSTWYDSYINNVMNNDVITLASIILGLVVVYFLGKIAFKFIKWIIIILIIILALRIIL